MFKLECDCGANRATASAYVLMTVAERKAFNANIKQCATCRNDARRRLLGGPRNV